VRPFNTYGPRQSARAVIPAIIIQALNGNSEIKMGNLLPTRDMTYVKDTCYGFLEIFKSDTLFGEVTNIGMNSEISIGELARHIIDLMNLNIPIIEDKQRIRPENSEVERLFCNNEKLLKMTTWKPVYDLKSGLEETIIWIRKSLHFYKSELYHV
jgi:nucleoside-diphosphate-sugar epimerase